MVASNPKFAVLLHLFLAALSAARRDRIAVHGVSSDMNGPNPDSSTAPLVEFHIYRAGQSHYPAKNSDRERSRNFANAAGVLRYIHNEVIGRKVAAKAKPPDCQRKYEIDKIYRYKVTMRTTEAAFKAHKSFLGFVAMDLGKCTTPGCVETYEKWGYIPGCQNQDVRAFHYPDAVWYSFPGRCPGKKQVEACNGKEENEHPGGACRPMRNKDGDIVEVTGAWNCTYIYQPDGEITLDELSGIAQQYGDYTNFCQKGGVEFNGPGDNDDGVTLDFWKQYGSVERNQGRIKAMLALFKKKYPNKPLLDDPGCGRKEWVRPSYWPS